MLEEKTWGEFKETGLLWFINSILHLFGWAIVTYVEAGETYAYPARTQYRGFTEALNDMGYKNITKYLKDNIDELYEDVESL